MAIFRQLRSNRRVRRQLVIKNFYFAVPEAQSFDYMVDDLRALL